jgi:prophage antirepressor-like protein
MQLFTFDYHGKPFRAIKDSTDQSEWFLFSDIANILDLPSQALNSLVSSEKRTIKPIGEPDHIGKVVVSLPGLNKLIDIAERKENSLLN